MTQTAGQFVCSRWHRQSLDIREDRHMIDDDLETVYTTTHAIAAEMMKMALENEGIGAYIEGENQAGLAGVLNISVRVSPQDVERAEAFIDEFERSRMSGDDESVDEAADDEEAED